MNLLKEEFEKQFAEGHQFLLEEMANSPEVDVQKFYSMACIFENLSFFSGVIYDAIQEKKG